MLSINKRYFATLQGFQILVDIILPGVSTQFLSKLSAYLLQASKFHGNDRFGYAEVHWTSNLKKKSIGSYKVFSFLSFTCLEYIATRYKLNYYGIR